MSDTDYLNKYWIKLPSGVNYLEHKKFFMTKKVLKDFTFKLAKEEFPYTFHTTYVNLVSRLERKGYEFSHKLN